MWKTAPDPIDVQDFQFKLCCKIEVFNNKDNSKFSKKCSLVASANRFDLIILGTTTNSLKVIQLKNLQEFVKNGGDKANYPRREIPIPAPAKHISTNCEETILSVIIERDNTPWVIFYDIKSFLQQEIIKLEEIRLSPTPGVDIIDINWNPTLGTLFTACKSDGSLGVYELKQPGVNINELPPASCTTCFCWSPKGKQIAVGSKDGKITQYKPDLKAVKVINAPPLKIVHSLIGLQWISNCQFIGIFQPQNPNDPTNLIVIEAPKTGESSFINYDDICYSNGNTRPTQFYTFLQRNWNILMVASSNSMEVGVLSSTNDLWTQWIMGDASRAELPLNDNREESLPIGFALNTSSTQEISWGETSLPPAPILLLLSHFGTLCCFNVINLKAGIPSICSPPDPIHHMMNLNLFTTNIVKTENTTRQHPQQYDVQKTPTSMGITFGNVTNPVKPQELPKTQSSLFGVNQSTPVVNKMNTATSSVVSTPITPITTTPMSIPKNLTKIDTPQLNETINKNESQSEIDAEAERLFSQMVREECLFLESEIKNLLNRCKSLNINVGTDTDKMNIVQLTLIIDEFLKEIVDITTGQNAEVHSLKQNLLQTYAWYEEAKSRFNASQDKTVAILQRAQPLDSASEKQLADIRHSSYYLESQLTQANRALDEQWENFQDFCRKTYKIKVPTMEVIFRTMVNQMAIIQKQSYVLKDITSRIKHRSRQPIGPSLLINVEDPNELENELKRLTLEPESILEIQTELVKNRSKYFTKTKADNLRNFLKNRKSIHVTQIKPQLSNTTLQPSSASKLKQLSLLGAKLSPVSKDVVRKLDFIQSTPKTTTAPIDGLERFTQKFEQNNNKLPDEGFAVTPSFPIKTTLASGPNSAFVSTSLGIVSTAAVTNAPTIKPIMSVSSVVKTTPSFGINLSNQATVPNAEMSKQFAFTFTTKSTAASSVVATATTTTTTYAAKTSLFTFTTQPTTMTTTATPKTFNFSDKSVSTSNNIFKPATTTTSVFSSNTNKAPVFGVKPIFTSIAPTSVTGVAATTTAKPITITTPSLFSSISAPQSTVTITKPIPEAVPTVKITSSTPIQIQSTTTTTATSGTSLFTNIGLAPKNPTTAEVKVTTIGQSTIFATTAKTTPSSTTGESQHTVISTKPSLTITPIIPITSQQIPVTSTVLTTTTAASQATLIFASRPGITFTTTTITGTSVATPAFASVAPTVKAISTASATTTVTTTSSVFSSVSTSQPLNLVTSTKSSSFTPVTTQASIFGTATPATQTSIFGSTDKSKTVFGTSAIVTTASSATTATTSLFGTSIVSTSTAAKPSVFGSAPIFGSSAPSSSIFGVSTTATTTSSSSIFGTSTPATTSTTSIFGASAPATTSAASIFGNSTPATTSTPIFGGSVSTTTTTSSVFGGFGQTSTAAKPVFNASTPPTTSSIFGPAVSTSTSSVFGNVTSTFGSVATAAPATATTQFGNTTFGTVAASTATSPFSQQSSGFGQSPLFGSNNSFGSSPSSFGAVAAATTNSFSFGQSPGSIFGNAVTTNSGSIFGNTATTNSGFGGGSIFGGVTSTASPFGSPAPATGGGFVSASQPSSFSFSAAVSANSGVPPASGFGFGGLSVGSTPTTSTFGTSPANPFGATSTTEQKSPFGATPASSGGSIFGSGPVFGGNTSTSNFGSQPSFGGQSTFGQQSSFGQSNFGGSNSSNSNSSFFGSSATTGPFSATTGGGSVGQTGFGTGTGGSSFQTSSGFGSPSAFGSTSAAFGAAPSFGGAPTFGSSGTFGSPPKVFGSPTSTFGSSSAAQSPSFGNIATQPTVGFGNLAQTANSQSNTAPFSGNTSFSSWR